MKNKHDKKGDPIYNERGQIEGYVPPSTKRQIDFDKHFEAACLASCAWAYRMWLGAVTTYNALPKNAGKSVRIYIQNDINAYEQFRQRIGDFPEMIKARSEFKLHKIASKWSCTRHK